MEHEPPTQGVKKCSACERTKPVLFFSVNKHTRDGLAHECRECVSARGRERRAAKKKSKPFSFDHWPYTRERREKMNKRED